MQAGNAFSIDAAITSSPRNFDLNETRLSQQPLCESFKLIRRNFLGQNKMKLFYPFFFKNV